MKKYKKFDKFNFIDILYNILLYFYLKAMWKSKKSKGANVITKITKNWPEELWEWVSKIVGWTADSLFNIIAVLYELIMAWALKISEKYWSKDEEIIEHKAKIVNHHLNQSKKALNSMGDWAKKIGKWTVKTVKWAAKTIALSLQDTVGWLRDEDKNKEDKKVA